MAVKRTGHSEIDQQHAILDNMVGELGYFCTDAKPGSDESCSRCSLTQQRNCTSVLESLSVRLRAFLAGHATYEEKMMELLPRTPKCQSHIKEHKRAHADISRQLKRLSPQIAKDSPRAVSALIHEITANWLGDHTLLFDLSLVRHIESIDSPEIDFDNELVAMLDEYVFHNRPTVEKSNAWATLDQQKRKLEARGRFELLTSAQRTVFWLVVSGRTNKEIANQLCCSVNTVKTHRAAVFQKMEVKSALELVKKTDLFR